MRRLALLQGGRLLVGMGIVAERLRDASLAPLHHLLFLLVHTFAFEIVIFGLHECGLKNL
jgi:hypothetical protein